MKVRKPAYVHIFRDRHRKIRAYFRRGREKRVPLPGALWSSQFMEAYARALAGKPASDNVGNKKIIPGSMDALIASWYRSDAFLKLRPITQKLYRGIIERLRSEFGDDLVKELRPKHIRKLRDSLRATPAAANRLLSLLRLLMRHAVENDWREDDPTRDVKSLERTVTGFPAWSEADIAQYESHWPIGTRQRLALALLLHLGVRRADVIRLGYQHLRERGSAIFVRAQKTGEELTIPIHPALAGAINGCQRASMTFLLTQYHKPFASPDSFYNWFVKAVRKAGLPPGLAAHGLRGALVRRLTEARCTPDQIMAITGHRDAKSLRPYQRSVRQEHMAKGAMQMIGHVKQRRKAE